MSLEISWFYEDAALVTTSR